MTFTPTELKEGQYKMPTPFLSRLDSKTPGFLPMGLRQTDN
ncbi:hypothetical protein [Ferrovum myxofaciens]|nr:hypothetical protein [Ferrovum myxofaciens]